MPVPDAVPPRSSLSTVGAGVIAFAVVIVVVLLQGGAGRRWAPQRPTAANHGVVLLTATPGADAVALPMQPSQTIPQTEAGGADEVPLERAAAAPAEFAGRWFTCAVATDGQPVWWPAQRPSALGTPVSNSSKAMGNTGALPNDGHGQLAQLGATAAPLVLDVVCQSADLRTWPVRAFFDQAALPALPAVGKGTVVALQLLGTDAAGNLQARYLRVVDHARLAVRPEMPDWNALWTGPLLTGARQEVRCTSDGAAELRDPMALDPATLALAATQDTSAPDVWMSLLCRDARGPAMPVLVHGPHVSATELLGVAAGSEVDLQLHHAGPDGLVASGARLVAGGAKLADGDLRRVLLDGQASVGRKVVCTSQGVPLPELAQPEDPAVGLGKAPLADRKAWAVCAAPGAPAVQANLYLPGDHADRLLQIVRGSAVEARVLGVAGLRLQLVVERAVAPGGPAVTPVDPLDPPDLRRLVLFGSALRDRDVRCRLTRAPLVPPQMVMPAAALRLGAEGAVGLARLWCGDRVRPHAGQAIGVVGPPDAAKLVAALGPGSLVRLRFAGVVENQPVAVWLGPVEAESVGGPGVVTP